MNVSRQTRKGTVIEPSPRYSDAGVDLPASKARIMGQRPGSDSHRRSGAIHWMAYPVSGVGIAVPVFVPVVVTAIVAMLPSREDVAPLAYIAGSLGTLIGADFANLDKVRGLGAPVASIGGAGTFDGIFLTGILAVLLASLYARPHAAPAG
jgi:hypothetical protein